jgi:hypothetical protein
MLASRIGTLCSSSLILPAVGFIIGGQECNPLQDSGDPVAVLLERLPALLYRVPAAAPGRASWPAEEQDDHRHHEDDAERRFRRALTPSPPRRSKRRTTVSPASSRAVATRCAYGAREPRGQGLALNFPVRMWRIPWTVSMITLIIQISRLSKRQPKTFLSSASKTTPSHSRVDGHLQPRRT